MTQRVSLIDPLLYRSTYIDPHPQKTLYNSFWGKFNIWSCLFNVILPILILIIVLFFLKDKYILKHQIKHNERIPNLEI